MSRRAQIVSGRVENAVLSVPDASAVRRVTLWGMLVNVSLSGLKLAVGLVASSQALVADAVHSLSDLVTDVAVLVGVHFWSAPADEKHPYGHGRIETLVTVFIGSALAAVGVWLGYKAIDSMAMSHVSAPGWSAFAVALASILSKEVLYRWTARVGRRVRSTAMVANAWHHRSDALSSVPVAVAVLGMHLHPDWIYLDHVAALLVSILIVHAAWQIAWPALAHLVDAGADEELRERLYALALDTHGVKAVHALRSRHVGPALLVDLHVLVDPNLTVREGHDIAGAVKMCMRQSVPEVADVLVHVEPYAPGA